MKFPLFPLDTVLFPGCMLDLQLFEARYLDMVSACLRQGEGFGVVNILEGSEVDAAPQRFARIGCEALVRDWQQRPNGLLGIRVEGGRRFAVGETCLQADQLLLAEVDWLAEPARAVLLEEHDDLLALLGVLVEHPLIAELAMSAEVVDQRALSERLGYLLPLTREQKLELLAMDDPQRRLRCIQDWLERMQDG